MGNPAYKHLPLARRACRTRNITQADIARLLGRSTATVSKWSRRLQQPRAGDRLALRLVACETTLPKEVVAIQSSRTPQIPLQDPLLQKVCEQQGLTQGDISRLLRRRPGTVSRWNLGQSAPCGGDRLVLRLLAGETPLKEELDKAARKNHWKAWKEPVERGAGG